MKSCIVIALLMCSCAATGPEVSGIRALPHYSTLSLNERLMAEEIMRKALVSDRKDYYFEKLKLLINTPSATKETTKEMNISHFNRSVAAAKEHKEALAKSDVNLAEYQSIEERYEVAKPRKWVKYCPHKFSNPACFYYSAEDYTDILVHINIRLHGPPDLIAQELEIEDDIEKHLSIPGFNVNVVFTSRSGNDVFEVGINPAEWSTNENFAGGTITSSHEIMHLFGLNDSYDRIENHAGNPYVSVSDRLALFIIQMDDNQPVDAEDGIMCNSSKRPLQREVCEVVHGGKKCIDARIKRFGSAPSVFRRWNASLA